MDRYSFHYHQNLHNSFQVSLHHRRLDILALGHSLPFGTPGITLPSVTTLTPDVDLNSAVLQGQITDDGGAVCSAQFEYGTTTSYELGVVSVVPSYTTYSIGMICGAFLEVSLPDKRIITV